MKKQRIYISHAHEDQTIIDLIDVHLARLRRDVWEDRQIKPGEEWRSKITEAIDSANVTILLITPDFLASKFIQHEEIPRLLQKQQKDGTVILPVILHPCAWRMVPWLSELQVFPKNGKPISSYANPEEVIALLPDRISELMEISAKNESYMGKQHPRVFISYSHDSKEHAERVLGLANRLRTDGVDAWLDQYELAPASGWPRWMLSQIEEADFVLIIASPTYKRRFQGREQKGTGRGVSWEGLILTQALYDSAGNNKKVIPAIFEGTNSEESIPTPLRPFDYLTLPAGYELLLRQVYNSPQAVPAPLGAVPELKPKSVGSPASGILSPLLEVKLDINIDDAKRNVGQLQKALRKLAESNDIFITEIREGSAYLQISGDPQAIERLEKLLGENQVNELMGLNVIRLDRIEVTEETGPPWLADSIVKQVFRAADKMGLGDDGFRITLLGGLPHKVRSSIPVAAAGAAQLLLDLRYLNELPRLSDGTAPIHTWLETAELLKEDYQDANVFRQALVALGVDR